jgi:hypothetical protein
VLHGSVCNNSGRLNRTRRFSLQEGWINWSGTLWIWIWLYRFWQGSNDHYGWCSFKPGSVKDFRLGRRPSQTTTLLQYKVTMIWELSPVKITWTSFQEVVLISQILWVSLFVLVLLRGSMSVVSKSVVQGSTHRQSGYGNFSEEDRRLTTEFIYI